MKRTLAILFLALSFYVQLVAQVSYDANMTNIVKVTYKETSVASVVIASNIQSYVSATVQGGIVNVVQKNTVGASTCGEIIYQLTGTSTNGSSPRTIASIFDTWMTESPNVRGTYLFTWAMMTFEHSTAE